MKGRMHGLLLIMPLELLVAILSKQQELLSLVAHQLRFQFQLFKFSSFKYEYVVLCNYKHVQSVHLTPLLLALDRLDVHEL